MLVIQQQPLRPETGVIGVVTLGCHVCGVAHHVQGDHIQQCMTGCMQAVSEGQTGVLDALASCPWHSDVRSLQEGTGDTVLSMLCKSNRAGLAAVEPAE